MAVTISRPPKRRTRPPTKRLRGRKLQLIRRRVFEQQGYRCAQCGTTTPSLELDHRIPIHKGGKDELSNYQGLCRATCHPLKTKREREARDGGRS